MTPNSSEAQTEKNGKRSKKHDLFLVLAVLAAAALLFAGRKLFFSSSPAAVTVSVDGTELMTLDLNQDGEQIIESPGGGTNRLVIKDGAVHMEEASCPDKVCIKQGTISKTGQSIVCLPNRVIVTITGTDSQKTD